MLTPSKATFGSSVMSIDVSSGNAQSSSSIAVPSAALTRRRDLEQAQRDRRVRAEHRAARDAEQQRVADLAGGAGDGNLHWRRAHPFVQLLDHGVGELGGADRGRVVAAGLEVVCDPLPLADHRGDRVAPCAARRASSPRWSSM